MIYIAYWDKNFIKTKNWLFLFLERCGLICGLHFMGVQFRDLTWGRFSVGFFPARLSAYTVYTRTHLFFYFLLKKNIFTGTINKNKK